MLKILISAFLFVISVNLVAQSPSWHVLPNSSSTNWRHDDLSFINEKTGWVVYNTLFGGGNNGKVFKTTDGGNSWVQKFNVIDVYLRCIGFTDSLNGWVGTLGDINFLSRTPIMYKTTNGGNTWDSVVFAVNRPRGLCGMSIANSMNIFACGRVNGPAYFIKTTNGGLNWVSQDMRQYASVLIDCYFLNKDSGFVVGGIDTPVYANTKAVVLYTSNGGNNWINRFTGSVTGEICWKLSFGNSGTGYASIETYDSSASYLKTTNAGLNWQRHSFTTSGILVHIQGIGFLNGNTGWLGGDLNITFKTTNGGLNWQQDNFGNYINRIRFLNDSIGFAGGKRIYKFTREPIGIQQISAEVPKSFTLHQNYPNPFNPSTKIKFDIPKNTFVTIKVYNSLGKESEILVNQQLSSGSYSVNWDASAYPSGIYFYKLITSEFSESKKMILIK